MNENDELTVFPWDEGQPTKPEVDALLKQWPPETIKPGEWRATDDEMREIIRPRDTWRYRTVYARWINRLLRDHGVVIYRQKETGFFCPTADQIFARTHPTLVHAGQAIGKQIRAVARAQPRNEIESGVQDHQGRLLAVQKRELKKSRMNLLPPTAAEPIPKIAAPIKAPK